MEFIRRGILFLLGFIAAVSIMIADDRMAMQYGYVSPYELDAQVREMTLAVLQRWDTTQEERDPKVLEAFITQKI